VANFTLGGQISPYLEGGRLHNQFVNLSFDDFTGQIAHQKTIKARPFHYHRNIFSLSLKCKLFKKKVFAEVKKTVAFSKSFCFILSEAEKKVAVKKFVLCEKQTSQDRWKLSSSCPCENYGSAVKLEFTNIGSKPEA
jgi:hypothetical protein